jgi:streptomycin 6-kinase
MSDLSSNRIDLSVAKSTALAAASAWGVVLEEPFELSTVSYVAPAGDVVVKVPWEGDTESLHEPDALELWNGDGAVRLLNRYGSALLEERALPGDDLSNISEKDGTAIAVTLAHRLWWPASAPFRPVLSEVPRWLDDGAQSGNPLVPLARQLLGELPSSSQWLVHGDFHHHNIIRRGDEYVAIDPKPYLADREYDVPSFLWNPRTNQMDNPAQTESRIAAFVSSGLDDFLIRAWTVIRGAYLRPEFAQQIRNLF